MSQSKLPTRGSNYRPVRSEMGLLASVFILNLRINLSAYHEDLQAHSEFPGERVGIFLRLRFGSATDSVGWAFEFD
jgi:hypothetical protein